jgi:hypothetical protein
MEMQIEVDFEVYKALTLRRINEADGENDVMRRLLGLDRPPATNGHATQSPQPSSGEWVTKGVRFPTGTEFRADYKGRTYTGRVEEGGLVVNGKKFYSPSAAAVSITGNPVNGWLFWECRLPGHSWRMLKSFRKKS